MVRTLAVMILVLSAGTAAAHPPPPMLAEEAPHRPAIDWSTWFRLAIGMEPTAAGSAARSTTPPPERHGHDAAYEAGLGAEATISAGLDGDLRIGPWVEVRGLHDIVAGGEIVLQRVPKSIDMFFYKGQGVLMLRGGANTEHVTAQVAYGYLAPWKLFDAARGETRYTIGVRFVASYTRDIADPHAWIATIGLEAEPVGALRYLLGIRSWY